MKSVEENLERRGHLSDKDFRLISDTIKKNIVVYLDSEQSYLRTAAVRFLKQNRDDAFLPTLQDMLRRESVLYTKIELCECLAEYGEPAIEGIIPLLGKIGRNQHQVIANCDLGKKSYPLPRDIAARILIRMGPVTLTYLAALFENPDAAVLSEAIDVVGHIAFNYRDYSLEGALLAAYTNCPSELIEWKLIRAFQSFNCREMIRILEATLADETKDVVLRNEAERSLARIRERNAGSD